MTSTSKPRRHDDDHAETAKGAANEAAGQARAAAEKANENAKSAANEAVGQTKASAEKANETAKSAADDGAKAGQEMTAKATETAKQQLERTGGAMREGLDRTNAMFAQFSPFGREAAELFAESQRTALDGIIRANGRFIEFARSQMDDAFETTRAVLSAKSREEAVSIQSAYAKKAMQQAIEEAKTLGELYVSTGREASKPMSEGFERAFDKASERARQTAGKTDKAGRKAA